MSRLSKRRARKRLARWRMTEWWTGLRSSWAVQPDGSLRKIVRSSAVAGWVWTDMILCDDGIIVTDGWHK